MTVFIDNTNRRVTDSVREGRKFEHEATAALVQEQNLRVDSLLFNRGETHFMLLICN